MNKLQKSIPICTVERISDGGQHAAFTDLIIYKGYLLCCYRQASSHMSEDGLIAIYSRKLNRKKGTTHVIEWPNSDLRDHKFLVDGDNKLWVSCYPRILSETPAHRQMFALSTDRRAHV